MLLKRTAATSTSEIPKPEDDAPELVDKPDHYLLSFLFNPLQKFQGPSGIKSVVTGGHHEMPNVHLSHQILNHFRMVLRLWELAAE